MDKIRQNSKVIGLYVGYFAIICLLFFNKTDYYVDELFTYNLSNAQNWFAPENGVVYTPAPQPFIDGMASNGDFDLSHVWQQQANDTHPPFYYLLVHLVMCFFPGRISIRYPAIINIVFALLTLFIFRKILNVFIDKTGIVFGLSVAYCFASGILSIISFLRMYVMAMFFVSLFSLCIIHGIEKMDLKRYILMFITTVCGALTH